MTVPPRIAVLASGRGSNLQCLIDGIAAGQLEARIVGVFSDRPGARALDKVPAPSRWARSPKDFASREAFDEALGDAVAACNPDWIVCAGYMRILGAGFVERFSGRLVNIHPSLLPRHKGLHTHARAIEAGDTEHGASVHFVVPELDAGAVIAQARVPVLADDTPESLAARVLAVEHPLLLASVRLLATGRVTEQDGRIRLDGQSLFRPLRLDSAGTLCA
ncbi:phosphoribosylglycinamide formyltransferase [Stenotrophomonas pictorum JCM 9942]|jgi:phosphoribosylglycinamide formyltransferase-1|uniref:Phosphoribosylglycinamide formyltransferase n=1 Tax=Stenotrophomonas pictorum JCM 9942 TaxID=1236960 RepID=A0A0R0A3V1_9GAMM|nr:phosphoribosylglycinamide formyltransferase [Stenotrophomonas pictorum]KRG39846.1 phosphoribosylglycinamide formyltransferase [Stenotrophomonas pictorum JCM 9942]